MKLKVDVTLNEVKSLIKFLRGFITQYFTQHDVRILFLLILTFNFIHTSCSSTRQLSIFNLYAESPYVTIVSLLQSGDTEQATLMLEKMVKKDKKESQWYKLLDDTYKSSDLTEKRIEMLEKALKVKDVEEPEVLRFRLAMAMFDAERFDEAIAQLGKLRQTSLVKHTIAKCNDAKMLKENALDIEIAPMSDSINTPYDNIWPFIDTDKRHFYTTVVVGKSASVANSFDIQEDIFCSTLSSDGRWLPAQAVAGELHSNENEGACCISADGKYMFFAACNRRGGGGGCELYYSINHNGRWSRPVLCPAPLNSLRWQSTPSLSADGKTLYFSAIGNIPDGSSKGDKDIFKCNVFYNKDGSLSFYRVEVLGPEVNTPYNEISPFISPYGDLLYFSSDGHGGMGGLDVCYSRLDTTGAWGNAVNIGYPINTHRDEFGFVVDVTGEHGYMSCNGLAGGEYWPNKRIVSITLPEEHRSGSGFEQKGEDFTLENIYFDTDVSTLRPESFPYLDAFVQFLTVHPSYKIHITGHTDDTGTQEHNLTLSLQRAESVGTYLKEHGISAERITTEGVGSSQPVSLTENSLNRRIEIHLLMEN